MNKETVPRGIEWGSQVAPAHVEPLFSTQEFQDVRLQEDSLSWGACRILSFSRYYFQPLMHVIFFVFLKPRDKAPITVQSQMRRLSHVRHMVSGCLSPCTVPCSKPLAALLGPVLVKGGCDLVWFGT